MVPISVVALFSSLAGARTKGIRVPFFVSIGTELVGCICLLFVNSGTPAWMIAAIAVLFGLPQGMFATATQAAVYIQAPAKEIGTASGLQRTAQYIGAIAGMSLLGLMFGRQATDHAFHNVAVVMVALTACLLIVTIFDRTLPRGRV
jgi:sugar phosphate permease